MHRGASHMVKKLMQPLAHGISGGHRGPYGTESSLPFDSFGRRTERAGRYPCPGDSARDDNVPHILGAHAGGHFLYTG
jgi:hypothetical protein